MPRPLRLTAAACLLGSALLLGAGVATAEPAVGGVGDTPERTWQQARDAASDLVLSAMNYLGVPYRRGGSEASRGFDCSGFTRHVFQSALGVVLPRRAAEQALKPGLAAVTKDQLVPGDLVFFNTMRRAFSHVGIYIGDGRFIHAPRAGGEVRIERMDARYWAARYNGARRAAGADRSSSVPGGHGSTPATTADTAVDPTAASVLPSAESPGSSTFPGPP